MPGVFRVGVYIDGYNLYYGGNRLAGDGRWKWLDLRALVVAHIPAFVPWDRAVISANCVEVMHTVSLPLRQRIPAVHFETLDP